MRVLAGAPSYQQAGPRLAPPSTRFKTIVGMTYTIALQYERGKQVRSRLTNEEEMMYSLTTGEKAYFPLSVGAAIDSLTLAPGQPFTVCHHGGGNWDIDRAPTFANHLTEALAPPAQPMPPQRSEAARPTAGAPPQSDTRLASNIPPPQLMNGSGEDLPAILTRCYAGAIDVTVAAVEAARAKGLTFLPTHEGLQACAATLFIAETRRQS